MASVTRRRPHSGKKSPSTLASHNVVVAGRRTSVRLEPSMWDGLCDIARMQEVTINDLVTQIDKDRDTPGLTAAIRIYVLNFYRNAAARVGREMMTVPM